MTSAMTSAATCVRLTARITVRIIVVTVLCAIATMVFGWMSVPAVGFLYGLVDRNGRARGTTATLGGALGWLAILCVNAARGADIGLVAERVGDVMQLPAAALVLVTLTFAAVLSGAAAIFGAEIGQLIPNRARRL